jgi:hypothetical protein
MKPTNQNEDESVGHATLRRGTVNVAESTPAPELVVVKELLGAG